MKKKASAFYATALLMIMPWSSSYSSDEHADHAGGGLHHVHDGLYEVQPGDTLWQLADEYHGDVEHWRELQRLNQVAEPRLLRPGRLLDLGALLEATATVVHVHGDAWQTGERSPSRLMPGQEIIDGQWLETGSNSFVTLLLPEGERVVLPSRSRIKFTANSIDGAIRFHLEQGEVESYVPSSPPRRGVFDVVTPTGIIGVRGTHFRVLHEGGELRTSVVDGSTAILGSASAPAVLQAGEGALINTDGELYQVDLLEAPRVLESRYGVGGKLEISLSSIPNAHAYRVQLDHNSNFETIVQDGTFLTTEIGFDEVPEGFYYARVSAIDTLGIEGWSEQSLIFHRPISAYIEVHNGVHEFHWTRVPGVDYQLQLSSEESFIRPFVDLTLGNSRGAKLRNLPPGEFYWRLLASSQDGDVDQLVDSGVLSVVRQ